MGTGEAATANGARNLLVELFVEELPPKSLRRLGEAFSRGIFEGLARAQLVPPAELGRLRSYASPRRLGVWIPNVRAQAADRELSQKLMPASVGFDAAGQPTPALLKKLASLGAGPEAAASLQRRAEGKAEALYLDSTVAGAALHEGLQQALDETVAALPIAKLMSYQLADGWSTVNFVRPVHGLVALHGADVVPIGAFGIAAGRETHGHRFEAAVEPIVLRDADGYAERLRDDGAVIADYEERRAEIQDQLEKAAAQAGGTPIDDAALLDEVTSLVERPNVLVGQFDPAFLDVPQECLILTMKANQKYFPLLDAGGKLTNRFLIVANVRPADAGAVVGGNERVVRPRLADAKFFFDQDRRKTLASRVPGLAKVVYHGRLGTQGERVERVRTIARAVGLRLGGQALADVADRAAMLAKADLLTDMVGEFPELQGVMGGYYARHDGEPDAVALAIEDHYKPRFAGDALPRQEVGLVVALSDKLETLVGLFGIGQMPSGDKDPFALRRHALGLIRMLIERELPLPLPDLIEAGEGAFAGRVEGIDVRTSLEAFFRDRLAVALRDQGYASQQVEAVLALDPPVLAEIPKRLAAVRAFEALPEAGALAAANKRVGNILKKAEGTVRPKVDAALLREPAEQALAQALAAVAPQADAAFAAGDYGASLQALAVLKPPVDAFFDAVMVNADDAALRANRLGLLALLHAAMNRVADLSKLAA